MCTPRQAAPPSVIPVVGLALTGQQSVFLVQIQMRNLNLAS